MRASGALFCRGLIGSAGIAGDVQVEAVGRYPRPLPRRLKLYLHGTNHAGFEEQAIFRCQVTRRGLRYSARCANRLHDRFSYSFTVVPPAPKTPTPTPQPPTNCQGYDPCLPPGDDVDCRGGGGNGPRYVDGPVYVSGSDPYGLDSDGDGVACES